jgi:two-component system nitrogen regulation response regulator NtrX
MSKAHILVVDDEPDIRTLLKEILEDEGYEVETAENATTAREARRSRRPDLILLDIWMPDVDGITLLKEWTEEGPLPSPVIMMSGHGTVETAVEATRLGAYDFIEKPLSLAKLLLTLQRALEAYNLNRENLGLRQLAQPAAEPVGHSKVMQNLREQIRRIAQHNSSVLISGEPGTGKGLFAHYLHSLSERRQGPFIELGVASLLGESPTADLFGQEQDGKIRFGLLEQANGGTLFLDDIGDMDLTLQARLLGALESGSYLRVGGNEPVQIDVRIIAASRYDLEQLIREGKFRDDLFYHLNVLPLTIPPLREHNEDVPDLLNFYIDYFIERERLPYRNITVAAQNRLRNYEWRGNVRELKNLVQRLLIVGTGSEIDIAEVESAISSNLAAGENEAPPQPLPLEVPLRQAREQFEHDYFEALLIRYHGSVNKVAQHAEIERTHLYRKLRSLGLDPKKIKFEG